MFKRSGRRASPASAPVDEAPRVVVSVPRTEQPASYEFTGLLVDVPQLVVAMLALEESQAGAAAVGVLEQAAFTPSLVLRMEETVRAANFYQSGDLFQQVELARGRVEAGLAAPVGLAVASLHADGRLRERAVRRMAQFPMPVLVPFLVLRAADFVPQVREAARAVLANMLFDGPRRSLDAAAGMAAVLARRERAGFALAQVRGGIAAAPVAQIEQWLAVRGTPVPVRRMAADQATRLPLATVARLAGAEADPATRDRLAETAVRGALWTGRHEFIRALALSCSPDVRAIALAGLLRAGMAEEAAGFLADPSPKVRASARFAARRAGIDVLARYRDLAGGEHAVPGALLGLAEEAARTGAAELVRMIEPRLADPAPRMRAAAVTALQLLDAVDVDLISPLLADPASPVVRAAADALRSCVRSLDPGLLLGLLDEQGRATGARRAIYRLAREHSVALFLAAALSCVGGGDEKLCARAEADLRQLALPAGWPRRPPQLRIDPIEPGLVPDLPARLAAVREALDPEIGDAVAAIAGIAAAV